MMSMSGFALEGHLFPKVDSCPFHESSVTWLMDVAVNIECGDFSVLLSDCKLLTTC